MNEQNDERDFFQVLHIFLILSMCFSHKVYRYIKLFKN